MLVAALQRLKDEGWSLNEESAMAQLQEAVPDPKKPEDILKAALDLDLKQVGAPCLPDDINRADSKKLIGPHVLQLVESSDISQPARFQDTPGDRKGRLLRLKLSDGSKSCVAVEYTAVPALRAKELIPGTKVKILNATIRVGCILLEPKCVSILGGRVERLAAAFEAQQMYGGTVERSAEGKKADADDKPPPFKHFDPNSAPKQAGKVKKALAAVSVPTVAVVAPTGSTKQPNKQPEKGGEKSEAPRAAMPTPAAPSTAAASAAAKAKLLERLQAHEEERGRGGRGRRGGGRRGRRGRDDDADDAGTLTLEEWEARQKQKTNAGAQGAPPPPPPGRQQDQAMTDEELARQLQEQLDLEDMAAASAASSGPPPGLGGGGQNGNNNDLKASLMGMFSYEQEESSYGGRGGGRGRGRGRGGGRRGGRGGGGGRGESGGGRHSHRGGGRSGGGRGRGRGGR